MGGLNNNVLGADASESLLHVYLDRQTELEAANTAHDLPGHRAEASSRHTNSDISVPTAIPGTREILRGQCSSLLVGRERMTDSIRLEDRRLQRDI